ncbi:hypothetical protein [Scytonema millei]|nr:hypothetical protein [Scytonema millei]
MSVVSYQLSVIRERGSWGSNSKFKILYTPHPTPYWRLATSH